MMTIFVTTVVVTNNKQETILSCSVFGLVTGSYIGISIDIVIHVIENAKQLEGQENKESQQNEKFK